MAQALIRDCAGRGGAQYQLGHQLFDNLLKPTPMHFRSQVPDVPSRSDRIPAWIAERLRHFQTPDFTFDLEPHEYRLGDRVLTSCTSWLKKFKEPFDAVSIAESLSQRRGCSPAEILAEWERAGWVGTKMHEFIEDHYNGITHQLGYDPEVDLRCAKFLDFKAGRLQSYEPVGQEVRVFHEASGICGTLDLLAWHPGVEQLYVIDWKSSRKIGNDQDNQYRKMYGPFADLWDHEHNVYSLQISLYRLMLEAQFIPTAGGAIGWLPGGDTPAKLIPAIDFRERLRAMLF